MSTLLASLGGSPGILAEVLGLTNFAELGMYVPTHRHYNEIQQIYDAYFSQDPVREVWVLTTKNSHVESYVHDIREWNATYCGDLFHITFFLLPFEDISSADQASYARECAARLLYTALKRDSCVFISIAGGRKTMSSDLHSAGHALGCEGFIHVIAAQDGERRDILHYPPSAVPEDLVNNYTPLWYGSARRNDHLLKMIDQSIDRCILPCEHPSGVVMLADIVPPLDRSLTHHLEESSRQAWNVFSHGHSPRLVRNFPILHRLDDQDIERLSTTPIDEDTARKIPKIDLHCHLGGSLTITDTVAIAAEALEVEFPGRKAFSLDEARAIIEAAVRDPETLEKLDHCVYLQTLAAFRGHEAVLEAMWYGDYLDEREFCGVAASRDGAEPQFYKYEQLGDLQGSTLLQTETAIRRTVQTLIQASRQDSCIGLELRCSPQNYTKQKLSYSQVLKTILKEIDANRGEMEVLVILIASRHRKIKEIQQTIKYFLDIRRNCNDPELKALVAQYVRGFDVAGPEHARSAKNLRKYFLEILKDCFPITIHAGETQNAESIWDAVYALNADRIGHGLTLIDNPALVRKFLDRRIGIELCPSSNYQIIGYDDFCAEVRTGRVYPLKRYLDDGLKVTVNTDNRGISRTTLAHEFVKASNMTKERLSVLDALQLCKNSLDISFFSYDTKERLYTTADTMLELLIRELLS
jgi:adenosine deaminase